MHDSISSKIFTPQCQNDGSVHPNYSRNSNITDDNKFFLLYETSLFDSLIVTNSSKIYKVAERAFFQSYNFFFIALNDENTYSFFSSSLYIEMSSGKSKQDILNVLPAKQKIRKHKNGYIIDLNEDIKRGFQYWVDYYNSLHLCSTITLNQITL